MRVTREQCEEMERQDEEMVDREVEAAERERMERRRQQGRDTLDELDLCVEDKAFYLVGRNYFLASVEEIREKEMER